jgi:CarD family transcriptional regulator
MTSKFTVQITKPENTQLSNQANKQNNNIKQDEDIRIEGFKTGDYAFYPSHGVGKIIEIETIEITNTSFHFLIIYFEKEKLTIKIPSNQIIKTGLRALISKSEMDAVFDILKSGVKKLKGMWSRRAQEYESKINSGNIVLLAEVLRDLTRDIEDGDRSYSERIIYETAIDRLALEYSIIENIPLEEAKGKIISTAKHKLGFSEIKEIKDNFDDEFDADEEVEESESDDDDDDDDDKPKKKNNKKSK